MAKRNNNGGKSKNIPAAAAAGGKKPSGQTPSVDTSGAISTPVRNTAVPRNMSAVRPSGGGNNAFNAQPSRREITSEMIARRAYEIWQRGQGGSQQDHWYQAERELRGQ
jgi:Protein of unknown function (DUF2934)